MKIKFEIGIATRKVGSRTTQILEVDKEDIEHLDEEELEDYVWEHLGGQDAVWEMIEATI